MASVATLLFEGATTSRSLVDYPQVDLFHGAIESYTREKGWVSETYDLGPASALRTAHQGIGAAKNCRRGEPFVLGYVTRSRGPIPRKTGLIWRIELRRISNGDESIHPARARYCSPPRECLHECLNATRNLADFRRTARGCDGPTSVPFTSGNTPRRGSLPFCHRRLRRLRRASVQSKCSADSVSLVSSREDTCSDCLGGEGTTPSLKRATKLVELFVSALYRTYSRRDRAFPLVGRSTT